MDAITYDVPIITYQNGNFDHNNVMKVIRRERNERPTMLPMNDSVCEAFENHSSQEGSYAH